MVGETPNLAARLQALAMPNTQKLAAAAGPQFCERPPKARFALDSPLEGAVWSEPVSA